MPSLTQALGVAVTSQASAEHTRQVIHKVSGEQSLSPLQRRPRDSGSPVFCANRLIPLFPLQFRNHYLPELHQLLENCSWLREVLGINKKGNKGECSKSLPR